jgi:NAD(P)-dependent dehydrogenase (short-subunit alcohol dehydrogenase family)
MKIKPKIRPRRKARRSFSAQRVSELLNSMPIFPSTSNLPTIPHGLSMPSKPPYTLFLTGGTGAIGHAIARHFARQRSPHSTPLWDICIASRDRDRARSALRDLPAVQGQLHSYVVGDVGSAEFWAKLVGRGGRDGNEMGGVYAPTNTGEREWKEEQIDLPNPTVLVNAAGFVQRGPLARMRPETVTEMVNANLMATMWSCKYMLPGLLRAKQARREQIEKWDDERPVKSPCIVNISSLLGQHGGAGAAVYAAAKGGIICEIFSKIADESYYAKCSVAFSRALAEEYGRMGVRVNTIVPGFIDTNMINDGVGEEFPFIIYTSLLSFHMNHN